MRRVYKYEVPIVQDTIALHKGWKPLMVAQDPGGIWCLWVEVDDSQPTEPTELFVVGTGHAIPRGAVYCGSFVRGPYVWHVYHG